MGKPENVLLDEDGHVKLCDMGFARFIIGKTYTLCGTPDYIAPEVLRHNGYSFAVDWWSFGVLSYELFTGHCPFQVIFDKNGDPDWLALLRHQSHGMPGNQFPYRLPGKARDFAAKLLQVDPARRMGNCGAAEVRQHDWFQGFDWEALRNRKATPPYVPGKFVSRTMPPELYDSNRQPVRIIMTEHLDKKITECGDKLSKEMSLQQAKIMLQSFSSRQYFAGDADWTQGFTCLAQSDDSARTKVMFKTDWNVEDEKGWTSFRSYPDLFAEYEDDGTDWDATFDLPENVKTHRSKPCTLKVSEIGTIDDDDDGPDGLQRRCSA